MKTKSWIALVVSVVTVALVATVIIIAVCNHNEAAPMGACWIGDRIERYEVDGAQNCPTIDWERSQFPLKTRSVVGSSSDPVDPIQAFQDASDFINQNLGFNAFVLADDADVLITIGVPYDRNTWSEPGGKTWHYRTTEGRLRANIQTANTGDTSMLNMVLIHEMLHVLGLAHDDWIGSIMYPVQQDGDRGVSFGRLWISDFDRAFLRSRYAPR